MAVPALAPERARELISGFSGCHILVVGDAMLDRFIVGRVHRISPEAPVPVVRFEREYVRLGGAANVAHNIAALGGRASLIAVVGRDSAGERLRTGLLRAGISDEGLVEDEHRPTVDKTRIVTDRHQHVARIDYEDDADVAGEVEQALITRIAACGRSADVLLVSDYLKGVVTPGVMRSLMALKGAGHPLLVDPKIPHVGCYGGATLVTPNNQEAEEATHRRIRSEEDARLAAIDFRRIANAEAVLVTRGEHGMWLSADGTEGQIPAVAREVSDVTGAGDTVAATLALAIASHATIAEAAILANHAAGVIVGKFGPATISRSELVEQFAG
jgi:D-beta-D-heptose 7-phosphate kinase/D-beta-D-heptose 1-phosphate adenosyltransferase